MISNWFKINVFSTIYLLCGCILFSGCNDHNDISIIPEISFKEYTLYKNAINRDTAITLVINFQDGDGDLGLEQGDTLPPFNPGSKYYACMYIYYYEFVDSQFKEVRPEISGIPVGDTIRFKYRFKNLTPNTPNKAIKGEIEWHTSQIEPIKSNVIKFKIFIYDRALHRSNIIESPVITCNP